MILGLPLIAMGIAEAYAAGLHPTSPQNAIHCKHCGRGAVGRRKGKNRKTSQL
jgi:hypothetical protein